MGATAGVLMRRMFLLAVPALIAVVVLRHPADPTTPADLGDRLGFYIGIHVALLILLPLLGLVMWALLHGIEGRAAALSRVLVVPAVGFYSAFDALVGIGAGVLAREALAMPQEARLGAEALAARWMEIPWPLWLAGPLAQLCWASVALSAALAHHRAGTHPAGVLGLATSALFVVHPRLTGFLGMVGLMIAVWAIELRPVRRAGTGGR